MTRLGLAGAIAGFGLAALLAGCGGSGSASSSSSTPSVSASAGSGAVNGSTSGGLAAPSPAANAGAPTLWGVHALREGGAVLCAAAGVTDVYNPALVAERQMRCTAGAVSGAVHTYSCAMGAQNQPITMTVSSASAQGYSAEAAAGRESIQVTGINTGQPCPSGWSAGDAMSSPREIRNIATGESRPVTGPPPAEVMALVRTMMAADRGPAAPPPPEG